MHPSNPAAEDASLADPNCIFDVLIVGAGLSGIGAAWHLQRLCPGKTYAILEARAAVGGTWDLFRYPGVRSDSDMYTLGYGFQPWTAGKAIADGGSIRDYIADTAARHGIASHIRFKHKATKAGWDSASACWTVETEHEGQLRTMRARFLYLCSGYYSYDEGYLPDIPGRALFEGSIVQPQFWPGDLDWQGKRVVVVGSGATAVTLVPAMA
jgi:monooxygenase